MTIMGRLLQHLEGRNTVAFSLPPGVIKAVEQRCTAEDYADGQQDADAPGESNLFDSDQSDSDRGLRQGKRKRRHDLYCSACSLPSPSRDDLAQCTRCPHSYHLWCLDPPLLEKPTVKWLCPSHPDESLGSCTPLYATMSKRGQTYVIPKANIRLDFPFCTTPWTPPTPPLPQTVSAELDGGDETKADQMLEEGNQIRTVPRPSRQDQREWLSSLLAFENEIKKELVALDNEEVPVDTEAAASTLTLMLDTNHTGKEPEDHMDVATSSEQSPSKKTKQRKPTNGSNDSRQLAPTTPASAEPKGKKLLPAASVKLDESKLATLLSGTKDPADILRQLPPDVLQQLALQRLEQIAQVESAAASAQPSTRAAAPIQPSSRAAAPAQSSSRATTQSSPQPSLSSPLLSTPDRVATPSASVASPFATSTTTRQTSTPTATAMATTRTPPPQPPPSTVAPPSRTAASAQKADSPPKRSARLSAKASSAVASPVSAPAPTPTSSKTTPPAAPITGKKRPAPSPTTTATATTPTSNKKGRTSAAEAAPLTPVVAGKVLPASAPAPLVFHLETGPSPQRVATTPTAPAPATPTPTPTPTPATLTPSLSSADVHSYNSGRTAPPSADQRPAPPVGVAARPPAPPTPAAPQPPAQAQAQAQTPAAAPVAKPVAAAPAPAPALKPTPQQAPAARAVPVASKKQPLEQPPAKTAPPAAAAPKTAPIVKKAAAAKPEVAIPFIGRAASAAAPQPPQQSPTSSTPVAVPAAAGAKRPSSNGATTSSPTNQRSNSNTATPTTPAPAPKVSATPSITPAPPTAAAAAPQPRATRSSPSSARPTQPKVFGGVTYNVETLSSLAAVADVDAHPVEGTEGPRLEFYMTGKKVFIGRRKLFAPNNPAEAENSLDLSDFPKANVISRKQVVVTAVKSGSFTVENFARNTTSLNGTPLLQGQPRTAPLPFELSFADVVVTFKPPAKPRVPAWWVAMWAEKREAREKENPKNPK